MKKINKETAKRVAVIIILIMVLSSTLIQAVAAELKIDKGEFQIRFSTDHKLAQFVTYTTGKEVNEVNIKKRENFYADLSVPKEFRVHPSDYTHTGYDRGHLASDASFDYDKAVLKKTYSMANIVPQHPSVNRGVWASLEELERYITVQFGKAFVENEIVFGKSILKKKRFEDTNYKDRAKFLKFAKDLERKKINLPEGFYKRIKAGNHKECYYVPNVETPKNAPIDKFKIDCGDF